jgi:uncharacterized membrane protein YgaE (UPF0421/DUF939 family)
VQHQSAKAATILAAVGVALSGLFSLSAISLPRQSASQVAKIES